MLKDKMQDYDQKFSQIRKDNEIYKNKNIILLDNESEMKTSISDKDQTINSLIHQLKQLQSHESTLNED